jgi:hypothetical protein
VAWVTISLGHLLFDQEESSMQRKLSGAWFDARTSGACDSLDLDELLHPAQAFETPDHVVNDPDLTLNEKRAILASWASDACAIESAPMLRHTPGGRQVPFDDVMDALRTLDRQARASSDGSARWRRMLRRERFNKGSDGPGGNQGHPMN